MIHTKFKRKNDALFSSAHKHAGYKKLQLLLAERLIAFQTGRDDQILCKPLTFCIQYRVRSHTHTYIHIHIYIYKNILFTFILDCYSVSVKYFRVFDYTTSHFCSLLQSISKSKRGKNKDRSLSTPWVIDCPRKVIEYLQ